MNSTYWFTTYQGTDWTPQRGGYNRFFQNELTEFRRVFGLKPEVPGVDVSTDWVSYPRLQGHHVYAIIDRFEWSLYTSTYDGSRSPYFRIKMRVAKAKGGFLGSNGPGQVIFNDKVKIVFPGRYPINEPKAQVEAYWFEALDGGHNNHKAGGSMCLFYDDWNPATDTWVSFMNIVVEWITWFNLVREV